MKSLFVLAAENSAETYAVEIIRVIRRHNRKCRIFGVGGDRLQKAGMDLVYHSREFSVVGVFEILSSIFRLKRCMNTLLKTIISSRPDAVLLIDYPDFNLRLAKKLHGKGIPVYYYISPTVWAWRYNRVRQLKRFTDHLFIIFPFEAGIYNQERIPYTYTGHPLIPLIRVRCKKNEFLKKFRLGPGEKVITLLPGSRTSEVNRLLPEMKKAAEGLSEFFAVRFFILQADNIDRELIRNHIKNSPIKFTLVEQKNRFDLINASDLVITTCGTSNLEIALLSIPFIVGYRVQPLTYLLKPLLKIKRYSIVNILAGEEVVPELIQQRFTAENIVNYALLCLENSDYRLKMIEQFRTISQSLSQDRNPPEIIYRKICTDLANR